jgi:hypothetical protein
MFSFPMDSETIRGVCSSARFAEGQEEEEAQESAAGGGGGSVLVRRFDGLCIPRSSLGLNGFEEGEEAGPVRAAERGRVSPSKLSPHPAVPR